MYVQWNSFNEAWRPTPSSGDRKSGRIHWRWVCTPRGHGAIATAIGERKGQERCRPSRYSDCGANPAFKAEE
ncbi:hypothetical protein N7510_001639 [Penicillium lagena]|uniref:uncharacterized protein n=1 Tax=Penicillium lagena TaxID=94218 RepID=UPI002541F273|nr:uncharacterized protein N7510_001639 [Penicillium lagena]KAJ5625330.1 hypothetical protein N7510_001639 [Penicillium lagena]